MLKNVCSQCLKSFSISLETLTLDCPCMICVDLPLFLYIHVALVSALCTFFCVCERVCGEHMHGCMSCVCVRVRVCVCVCVHVCVHACMLKYKYLTYRHL